MKRALITNDDGIAAPGLRRLAAAARDFGLDVVVAAPHTESSGVSAALTAVVEDGRVMIERAELPGLDGVTAYSVAASPAYIAVLASLGAFGGNPDLVLSGINRGANAGQAILHSGTVGAAFTAASHGARAMAVSLDVLTAAAATSASGGAAIAAIDAVHDDARHWDTAATLAARLLPALFDAPPATVFNLNVPDRPADEVRGLHRARLAPFGQVQMAIAESGEGYVRTTIEQQGARQIAGTDVQLLADGHATVTAVHPPQHADDFTFPPDLVQP